MRSASAKSVALGGILGAVAIVIMCLGGLIPAATFVVPMLCTIVCCIVMNCCGSRVGWAWYVAVSILSVLMSPDKEAAAVFVFLGYYPMVKRILDKSKLRLLWKLLLFNAAILLMYQLLIHLFGMAYLVAENEELGQFGLGIMLLLGNVSFIMLDVVLGRIPGMLKKRPGR